MLAGVTETSENGDIEDIRRCRPSFCEITHLIFYKIYFEDQWNLLKFGKITKPERQRIISKSLVRANHKLLFHNFKN